MDSAADADRRVVRRALAAGGSVAAVVAAAMVAGVLAVGGSGALGLAAVVGAITVGSLVTAAWLLVSVFFDLLANQRPGRHRVLWTIGMVLFAFIAPVLLLGALRVAA